MPSRFASAVKEAHEGMVHIFGGTFMMGGDNDQARADEFPKHKVEVSGFWMESHGLIMNSISIILLRK